MEEERADGIRCLTFIGSRAMEPRFGPVMIQVGVVVIKFINGLAYAGVAFIAYGSISAVTGEKWTPIERYGTEIAAVLTVCGTILTAASIYVFGHVSRPPIWFSRWVSAPLVIGASIAALVAIGIYGGLPTLVVNGFALLAIAGALFRMHPFVEEP
jgi:hypothetical protein